MQLKTRKIRGLLFFHLGSYDTFSEVRVERNRPQPSNALIYHCACCRLARCCLVIRSHGNFHAVHAAISPRTVSHINISCAYVSQTREILPYISSVNAMRRMHVIYIARNHLQSTATTIGTSIVVIDGISPDLTNKSMLLAEGNKQSHVGACTYREKKKVETRRLRRKMYSY